MSTFRDIFPLCSFCPVLTPVLTLAIALAALALVLVLLPVFALILALVPRLEMRSSIELFPHRFRGREEHPRQKLHRFAADRHQPAHPEPFDQAELPDEIAAPTALSIGVSGDRIARQDGGDVLVLGPPARLPTAIQAVVEPAPPCARSGRLREGVGVFVGGQPRPVPSPPPNQPLDPCLPSFGRALEIICPSVVSRRALASHSMALWSTAKRPMRTVKGASFPSFFPRSRPKVVRIGLRLCWRAAHHSARVAIRSF